MADKNLYIKIDADASGVEKGFSNAIAHAKNLKNKIKEVSDEIIEQRGITVEFQNELNRLRSKLAQTAGKDLAGARALRKEISHLTDAMKDNRAAVTQLSIKKQALNNELKATNKSASIMSASVMRLGDTAKTALPSVGGLISGFTGFSVAALVADGVMALADSLFHFSEAAKEVDDTAFKISMKPLMDEMNAALDALKDFQDAKTRVNDSFDEGTKAIQKEVNQVSLYYKVATDLNQTYENRHTALKNLQSIAPDYFNSFNTETILTQNATKAYEAYNKEAAKRIQIAGLIAVANAAGVEQAKAQGALLRAFGKKGQGLDFTKNISVTALTEAGINVDGFTESIWAQVDAFNYWQKEVSRMITQASNLGGKIEDITPKGATNKPKSEKPKNDFITISETNDAISRYNLGLGTVNNTVTSITGSQDKLTSGMEELSLSVKKVDGDWQNYNSSLSVVSDNTEALKQKQENLQAAAFGVANAFTTLGGVISDSMMKAAGDSADAFDVFAAKMVETIATLAGMAMANAIVGATQSGTATGPAAVFTTPAFIAAAIGGVTSAFAAAASFKPTGFADGGLIGGNSFSGDRLLAPVNSGEVVLNTGQQNELLRMVNGGGGGGQLIAKVSGKDLMFILDRTKGGFNRG